MKPGSRAACCLVQKTVQVCWRKPFVWRKYLCNIVSIYQLQASMPLRVSPNYSFVKKNHVQCVFFCRLLGQRPSSASRTSWEWSSMGNRRSWISNRGKYCCSQSFKVKLVNFMTYLYIYEIFISDTTWVLVLVYGSSEWSCVFLTFSRQVGYFTLSGDRQRGSMQNSSKNRSIWSRPWEKDLATWEKQQNNSLLFPLIRQKHKW